MKSNQLRIGNKVRDNNGFIFDVVSIHNDGTVYCDFEGNEGDAWEFDNNNPCQGIELTEEILLKCGFINIKEYTYIILSHNLYGYIDELEFFFEPNEDVCITFLQKEISQNDKSSVFFRNIRYLNELQNLYFALTNEELNIKL